MRPYRLAVVATAAAALLGTALSAPAAAWSAPSAPQTHRYRAIDLGTLGGATSVAAAVNDRGQVVGYSMTAANTWHGFLWQDGRMTDLGVTSARDINNRGQIVGGTVVGTEFHAYRWQGGVVTDLGVSGEAMAVNAGGTVVGTGPSASGYGHAVR